MEDGVGGGGCNTSRLNPFSQLTWDIYVIYFIVQDACTEPVFLNDYGAQESIPRN